MQMVDCLSAIFAGVDHGAIAFGQALLAGDFCYYPEQVTEQRGVFFGCFREGADVLARDDEHVDGCVRMNVGKGDAQFVFVDAVRGNGSFDDFAEEATHNSFSVSPAPPVVPRSSLFSANE